LHEELQNLLRRLQDIIVHRYNTNLENDKASWNWEKSGRLSLRSTYKHLCSKKFGDSFRKFWKAKIPLKIKIFIWLLEEAILTKDNLCKRKWKGNEYVPSAQIRKVCVTFSLNVRQPNFSEAVLSNEGTVFFFPQHFNISANQISAKRTG